jgi:hypothetical protein
MHHKNILRLIGYHKTENTVVLVFPFAERGSFDKNLLGKFLLPVVFDSSGSGNSLWVLHDAS